MEAVYLNTHPHILLAAEDKDLRELLHLSLTRAGYQVTCCDNGLRLLEQLEQDETYDLVVSDLRMPALTGLEVLECQHDNRQLPAFICITAFGDRQTHETASRFGAAATVDKPFALDDMLKRVNTICLRNNTQNSSVRSRP